MHSSLPIRELEPLVVLTGAGISAESGVPTFRGFKGLWENHRPEELATPQAFNRDPAQVWRFYQWRRELVADCEPNQAHKTLAKMQSACQDFTLITQNVDGLHQIAGNSDVIELHGSLWRLKCTQCKAHWEDTSVPMAQSLPECPQCGNLARPDVVWFGEALDPKRLSAATAATKRARTMLIVGTSAVVQPAAQLPLRAKEQGARLIEFNLEPTPLSVSVDETRYGKAGQTLPAWWDTHREPT